MPQREQTRDYFAEQFVAGVFADAGWNIYFPRRDMGFDFIVSKSTSSDMIIRPVQVKGKFPGEAKQDKPAYGWIGDLSATHSDMVLVIPYFAARVVDVEEAVGTAPVCIAFMPRNKINSQASRGFACQPARFEAGLPKPRRDYQHYFNAVGLHNIEDVDWGK